MYRSEGIIVRVINVFLFFTVYKVTNALDMRVFYI